MLKLFAPPDITPLEVWDVVIDGRTVFEWQEHTAALPAVLRRLVEDLAGGRAVRRGTGRPAATAFPIDGVVVVGGRAVANPLGAAEASPLVRHVDSSPFASVRAASTLADVVVDVGQTSIKAIGPGGEHRATRDGSTAVDVARGVTDVLRRSAGGTRPASVLLALPCEIGRGADAHDVVLGACSYDLPSSAAAFVALLGDDIRPADVTIANDAVLAAYGARPRLHPADRGLLALTLGHGVGAALVRRDAG